ncbi:hypothetical protein TNCV_4937761 [Trichonephila clavipes]|nr:hypothetical protein TNCV_4937761 [Trichonephila clavipes]
MRAPRDTLILLLRLLFDVSSKLLILTPEGFLEVIIGMQFSFLNTTQVFKCSMGSRSEDIADFTIWQIQSCSRRNSDVLRQMSSYHTSLALLLQTVGDTGEEDLS